MIKKTLILFSIFCFAQNLFSAPNDWRKLNAFGGAKKERAVSFVIGNFGYVGTGVDTAEHVTKDFWQYNPGTDTWTQKANVPGTGRRDAVGFSIGTKGYVGMGIDSADFYWGGILNDFYEYDPAPNTWTPKNNFFTLNGTGVYFATSFVISGKGYVCGGKISQGTFFDDVYQYDPALDQWTFVTNFPGGERYALNSCVINNKAYLGLGGDDNIMKQDWWEFNPVGFVWVQKSDFPPSPRMSASCFSIGNFGYLCAGTDGGFNFDLWEYNPLNDNWVQRKNFPDNPRKSAVSFSIGNKGYFGTGKSDSGGRRDFWEYSQILESVTDPPRSVSLRIFPNPASASSIINISGNETFKYKQLNYTLYDLAGSKIDEKNIEDNKIELPTNTKNGIYFIVIKNNNQIVNSAKISLL